MQRRHPRFPHTLKPVCSCELCRQRRKRTYTGNTYGGGEDFAESFAPPLVLFIAEEQAQQLEQQMRRVEVDSPRWRYFEYVLNSDSAVNSMLETALRSVAQSVT